MFEFEVDYTGTIKATTDWDSLVTWLNVEIGEDNWDWVKRNWVHGYNLNMAKIK